MPNHSQEVSKRSCNNCRQRKVRCDRKYPCEACSRSGKECIFPGPKRVSRRLNRPPVSELMARLKQLEDAERLRSMHPADKDDPGSNIERRGSSRTNLERPDQSGRLVVKDGRSRYVDDDASVIFGDKIQELRDVLESSSSEEDIKTEEILGPFGLPHGGLVGDSNRTKTNSKGFYPHSTQQLDILWRIYQSRVHPLIAVLHVPSVERMVRDAADDIALEPCSRSLILSVCFAAVVSMTPDQCVSMLGKSHDMAIEELSVAVNRALKQANFIKSKDIPALQAAVLFLLCFRVVGDTRVVWAEAAVVVRVAQGQGIHRDGTEFNLSPFETEIRRRLWWHICILDMLASEDQGTDTQIKPDTFDTRLPSNVDGHDLIPEMTELPPEKMGYTDITLCIINCEIATSVSKLGPSFGQNSKISISDREAHIKALASRLQDRYMDHFDLGVPIQWMVATIGRLMLSKVWLGIHIQNVPGNANKSAPARYLADPIFQTAVEITEFAYFFQENETTAHFAWLARSYKQWHALAYVLSELCVRNISPETDHAWNVVAKMYRKCVKEAPETYSMFQKPLSRLMERATTSRAEKLGISRELLDNGSPGALKSSIGGIDRESKQVLFPPMPDLRNPYHNPIGDEPTEPIHFDNIGLIQGISASEPTDYLYPNIDWLFEPLI
ncbi:fungal-specific transcription factor domain-containing protein [Aspergillus pseudocaelatus]|uniref:Fungal-specific transcription factor domain-containing protein n=1 Tax=Aspergillus pseudocaelatus TaxID=1825620 RepID=A0ABQ6WP43_9EURO|nr:fungal-specific transcription factor domain-containing protein [Aspergillus pseudocaelatus]